MLRHWWAWARGAIGRLLFYLPSRFPNRPLMPGHKRTALKTYLGRDVMSMFYSACSQNTTQHPHVWGKIPSLSLCSHLCSLAPKLTSQRAAAAGKNRHEMRQLSRLGMENWDMVYGLCSLSSSKIHTRAFSSEAASPAAQPMITGRRARRSNPNTSGEALRGGNALQATFSTSSLFPQPSEAQAQTHTGIPILPYC